MLINNLGNWVNNTRFKVQANGYWILHNHPSGNAAASRQDERFTGQLASLVPGFKGHVIINTVSIQRIHLSFALL